MYQISQRTQTTSSAFVTLTLPSIRPRLENQNQHYTTTQCPVWRSLLNEDPGQEGLVTKRTRTHFPFPPVRNLVWKSYNEHLFRLSTKVWACLICMQVVLQWVKFREQLHLLERNMLVLAALL